MYVTYQDLIQIGILNVALANLIYQSKNLHGKVVRNIKDYIEELSEMGFNTEELFIADSYIGANRQENLQYLCTEKGCSCYANKLEPEVRQKFISEFTERFDNMRCVAEGKPVKKTSSF